MNLKKKAAFASLIVQFLLGMVILALSQISPDHAGMSILLLAPLTLGFSLTQAFGLGGDFGFLTQLIFSLATNITVYFVLFHLWFSFRNRGSSVMVA